MAEVITREQHLEQLHEYMRELRNPEPIVDRYLDITTTIGEAALSLEPGTYSSLEGRFYVCGLKIDEPDLTEGETGYRLAYFTEIGTPAANVTTFPGSRKTADYLSDGRKQRLFVVEGKNHTYPLYSDDTAEKVRHLKLARTASGYLIYALTGRAQLEVA
jgi:hypothetical protein